MSEKASVLSWRGSDKYYNPYIGRGEVLFTGKIFKNINFSKKKFYSAGVGMFASNPHVFIIPGVSTFSIT